MDFYNRFMEKPWKIHGQPMYSKLYALCMRHTFSILMENPSFLHGVHVFSMEFHDFFMGNPWYIFVRDYTEVVRRVVHMDNTRVGFSWWEACGPALVEPN